MGIVTKWPRLLVVGDNVTPEQADQILIRTNSWYLFSNDKGWERTVQQLAVEFGYPEKSDDPPGFHSYGFECPAEHLPTVYYNARWPMGS